MKCALGRAMGHTCWAAAAEAAAIATTCAADANVMYPGNISSVLGSAALV
jgi:hypothetical protein